MPSKTKKQLDFFRLVKSYKNDGPEGVMSMWGKLFPNRKMPTAGDLEKITKVSDKIDYADLEDLSSGIEGDENLGNSKDIKVGYWMRFEGAYLKDNKPAKNVFIAKINRVRPAEKIAKFNSEEIYNRFGGKIAPLRSYATMGSLDYSFFKHIKETGKSKEDLVMKNESIRKVVRKQLNEMYNNEQDRPRNIDVFEGLQGFSRLTIKKRETGEEVSVSTGMFVQKVSDVNSKGKVKNVGVNFDVTPHVNNINVEWYNGDLAGTSQKVDPEDIEAM